MLILRRRYLRRNHYFRPRANTQIVTKQIATMIIEDAAASARRSSLASVWVRAARLARFQTMSAAASSLAGAIIALQGLQKARGGPPFSPKIARELVRNIGSAQLPGKNIGKLPDIRAMHLWMIADADGDGVSNIDEMIMGRNPYFDERKLIPILLSDD